MNVAASNFGLEGTIAGSTLGSLDGRSRDINKVIKVYCKKYKNEINLDNVDNITNNDLTVCIGEVGV